MVRRRKRSISVPGYIDEEVVIGDNGSAGVRFTCSYSRMIAEVAGEVVHGDGCLGVVTS